MVLFMLFFITACTYVLAPDSPDTGEVKMVPIALDLSNLLNSNMPTYGTNYPGTLVPGNAAENAIDNIVVYIFDNLYDCEKILAESHPSNPIGPVMVKSGIKHFIVVVNGDGKLTLEKTNPASVNYSSLLKEITNSSTTLPESPFLMTGIANFQDIPPSLTAAAAHSVTVKITRTCAKITMSVTKSGNAAGHNIDLISITMYRGADRVALFNSPLPDPTLHNINLTKTTFTPSNSVQNTPNYIHLTDTIYTYENLCGADTTKAIRFEILSAVNSPTNVRKAKLYLATYERPTGDSTYNVYRNYWYDVKVNIANAGMDSVYIDIIACPWIVEEPIIDSVGVGAKITTATPFKLVKNYTQAEFSANATAAQINTHSKGASWIDLEVTRGAPWGLILTDPALENNKNVWGCIDNGLNNWQPFPIYGTGIEATQRIYIYRPYREDDEPTLGPSFYVGLGAAYHHKGSFTIEGRDTLPIPTNSYILRPELSRVNIPLAGVFSHWEDYIYQNGITIPNEALSATVLWKDHPTLPVVKNVSIINAHKRDSAYIYCEAGTPGNAVIAFHVGTVTPTIFWTFHIWVTEYDPYQAAGQKLYIDNNIPTKNVFMDRNLGAMSNTYDAEGYARGLFYQYGKKDPFPRSVNWSNTPWMSYDNSNAAYTFPTASAPVASPTLREKWALQIALNYPHRFYTGAWTFEEENAYLWNSPKGNKTAYDPCPEGWRIPNIPELYISRYPWAGVLMGTGPKGFSPNISNPYTIQYGYYSPLVGYYPQGGYINSAGAMTNATTHARYWTSSPASNGMVIGLIFDGSTFDVRDELVKSWGASVRCVVDKNYIKKAENGGLFGAGVINLKSALLP